LVTTIEIYIVGICGTVYNNIIIDKIISKKIKFNSTLVKTLINVLADNKKVMNYYNTIFGAIRN